jgi:DNA helicase-2/ATP-dependent DNA helicase PcrA
LSLNDEQQEAIRTTDGPLLVLAGAGSGKTRVITYRILHLLEKGVPPTAILGLTFTNKAASEMKQRIRSIAPYDVLICTFHSLGARILRESIHTLGFRRDFTIYDEEDSNKLLKLCLESMNIPTKDGEAKTYRNSISHFKNHMITPEVAAQEKDGFGEVYSLYQQKLKECNAVDFDDLLYLPVMLFRAQPEILAHYQRRWSYVLVDEYQDTNQSQYELMRFLVAQSQNLCVVGDPDQSIYSWRGADISNILNFDKDFPAAKVIRLEQNYRSTNTILEAANAVICQNENRYEKNLWSALGEGEKIKLFVAGDELEEARYIIGRVQHYEASYPRREMVIFYRTNAQSRPFEDKLLQAGIPYVIVGGVSFYRRREIKDILAFLRMAYSGSDYISFVRTINLPKRGLGEATIEKIARCAEAENLSIFACCMAIAEGKSFQAHSFSDKHRKAIDSYVRIIRDLNERSTTESLSSLVKSTIDVTNYLDYLREDKETYEERQENLSQLVDKAAEWEQQSANPSLESFLEELSLKASIDEADMTRDRLNLMTIHNGKGLEFEVVFLAGLEEDLFPHINSKDTQEGIEEERRLCYVGLTRAKRHLIITRAEARRIWGTWRPFYASRFLREIPSKYIESTSNRMQFAFHKLDEDDYGC